MLVGYTARDYRKRGDRYNYLVINGANTPYTMIMTNVAFMHRFYLELFTKTVPKEVIDYIVRTTNGEDITMNVVIGKYLTEMGLAQPVGVRLRSKKLDIGNLSSVLHMCL